VPIQVSKDRRASRFHRADAADGLSDYGAGDALGLQLQQLEDKRTANTLAEQVAFLDAEVIEQRDVVGRIAVPAIRRGDRRVRLAAGVALIHDDDAEVGPEDLDRVDRGRRSVPDFDR
jgi:hypothetical protein